MNTQYTPSHWINDGTEISACVDPAVSRSYIAPICSLDTDWHPDIVAANARLIAAAPDLLELARQIVLAAEQNEGSIPADIVSGAVAAIAKALGENA